MALVDRQLWFLSFRDYVRPDGEGIQARALEAIDGFLGLANNRFVFVETCIQEHRKPGFLFEGANQLVVERILFTADTLQTPGIVDVIDGGQLGAFLGTNLIDMQHERRWVIVLEVFALAFLENRGRKWTKPFALLDARIQNILHSWQAGMSEYGAVAERTRTPFHAALKPAYNIARCDILGHEVKQRFALQFAITQVGLLQIGLDARIGKLRPEIRV